MLFKQFLVILFVFSSVFCIDYCKLEQTACRGKTHTGCTGTGLTSPSPDACKNKQIIEMTPDLKHLLLSEHNSWRNDLAAGNVKNFPSASRMLKMHWDDELASLAQKHVEFCVFEHDGCRATDKYPFSGQNIALKLYSHPGKEVKQMIKEMVAQWFEEYEVVPKGQIRIVVNEYKHNPDYGHFFVMAREKNEAVGCALVSLENTEYNIHVPHHFMLTCNYAETNIIKSSSYDTGKAGSRCDSHGADFKLDEKDCTSLCENSDAENSSENGKMCIQKLFSKASATMEVPSMIFGLICSIIALY